MYLFRSITKNCIFTYGAVGKSANLKYILDILVGWVPFYWLTKCTFMIWCMSPFEANGANIIYTRYKLLWNIGKY